MLEHRVQAIVTYELQGIGIAERIARAKQQARGDPFGLTADWEALIALSEAVWAHYQASKTKEAAEDYLSMIEDAASVVGAEGMRTLREQHLERVHALAPGSPAEVALTQPPRLLRPGDAPF